MSNTLVTMHTEFSVDPILIADKNHHVTLRANHPETDMGAGWNRASLPTLEAVARSLLGEDLVQRSYRGELRRRVAGPPEESALLTGTTIRKLGDACIVNHHDIGKEEVSMNPLYGNLFSDDLWEDLWIGPSRYLADGLNDILSPRPSPQLEHALRLESTRELPLTLYRDGNRSLRIGLDIEMRAAPIYVKLQEATR